MNEKYKPRRTIVGAKYGAAGLDWIPSTHNGTYGVGLCRFIIGGWDGFFSHIIFEMGDGSSIFLWRGKWCDGVHLKIASFHFLLL